MEAIIVEKIDTFYALFNYTCMLIILPITFTAEYVLLDLKHLLIEAKQKLPPFLLTLQAADDAWLEIGGFYYLFILLTPLFNVALIFLLLYRKES